MGQSGIECGKSHKLTNWSHGILSTSCGAGHQMSFCKTEMNRESDDGIESIYQSKIDNSLNSDSRIKEGVCYFLRSRLPTAEGTVNSRKVEVLRDTMLI